MITTGPFCQISKRKSIRDCLHVCPRLPACVFSQIIVWLPCLLYCRSTNKCQQEIEEIAMFEIGILGSQTLWNWDLVIPKPPFRALVMWILPRLVNEVRKYFSQRYNLLSDWLVSAGTKDWIVSAGTEDWLVYVGNEDWIVSAGTEVILGTDHNLILRINVYVFCYTNRADCETHFALQWSILKIYRARWKIFGSTISSS